ncbi:MAG: serine/threonine protein kinase, partial [Planctomycetes bacterium]|nr:serine/threonine protein kinase [Planctomycetota bacterium]
AQGINASEISSCEERISEGGFFDLIDAVRQNDLIDEPELNRIIHAIAQKLDKPDSLYEVSYDEQSEVLLSIPKLEQDSENFVPNLQIPSFELFDEASEYDFVAIDSDIDDSTKTNEAIDTSISETIDADNNKLSIEEPISEFDEKRNEKIQKAVKDFKKKERTKKFNRDLLRTDKPSDTVEESITNEIEKSEKDVDADVKQISTASMNEKPAKGIPRIEKHIVSSDDLDEISLKAAKEVRFDSERIQSKHLRKSDKRKVKKAKEKTDYVAPPPAGSTRKIKGKDNKKPAIKSNLKQPSTIKTADKSNVEKSVKSEDFNIECFYKGAISEASTRVLKSSLIDNYPQKMLITTKASKAQELVNNRASENGNLDIDKANLTNLKGYKLAGRYELIDSLGFGGNSAVYMAKKLNTTSDKIYAIKIISPEPTDPAKYLTRFKQEAEMLKRLSLGPNIVHINAYGKDENLYYLVLDYVEGESLAGLISRKAPLSEELTLIIIGEILKPLYHAHANGIIHRDIKPGNILVGKSGLVRLTDFGLAIDLKINQRKTLRGQILGTPHYMSPEQVSGKDVDARTDLYALGVVMYECLTGQKPFNEPTDLMLLSSIISKQPDKPSQANSRISKFTEKIILQLLRKEPRSRFQSARELYEVIAKAKLPTPQNIFELEPSIDDVPVMPSKPYPSTINGLSNNKKESKKKLALEKSSTLFAAAKSPVKNDSIHKRRSKRIGSEKLSVELGGEEKIMEILKIIETKQSIPYPGMKPPVSTREEFSSDRLKSIAKSNIQKFKHSIRKSQRIIDTINKSKKFKYTLITSGILLFLIVLFSISSLISSKNTIGINLPENTLAFFECSDIDSFQLQFQKSRYFRNESKTNEFLNTSRNNLVFNLVNSFGFSTDNDSKSIVESISKICCSFCKIDDKSEWAIIFELDNTDIMRKIKNDPEYKKSGYRISKINTSLPPILVVLSNNTLALASSKKYSVLLKGSFHGNTPRVDKSHLEKYSVEMEKHYITTYIDFEQKDVIFEDLNAYTWINRILAKGINTISIQALNSKVGNYTEVVPTTEQSFVLGQAEFAPKSEFETLKYVPINAVSSTSCNFSNIASGASWFNRYFPGSLIKDLILDEKQFITSLTGEVSVVKLMNFEQKVFILKIKRENTVSVEQALEKVFKQNMPIGDNVNNHATVYWRIDSDVLIITAVTDPDGNFSDFTDSEIGAMHAVGKGAILDCIKPVNSVEQKNITEHPRFVEVRSQLADLVSILHISTIRNFIGFEESVVGNAFSNFKMPYLVGFCFLEKENGDYAIQFSLNPTELLGLSLLKFCISTENCHFDAIEKTKDNQTQPE